MSISLTEDIKTVAELEHRPLEILRQIHETGRPVVVTVEGKPDVVMMDAATLERRLKTADLARLLLEGEADARAGRVRAAREFLREIGLSRNRVLRVQEVDEQRARDIIFRYEDKDFSMVDCISFALMERLSISYAFAFDRHFAQYGIQTLE